MAVHLFHQSVKGKKVKGVQVHEDKLGKSIWVLQQQSLFGLVYEICR